MCTKIELLLQANMKYGNLQYTNFLYNNYG